MHGAKNIKFTIIPSEGTHRNTYEFSCKVFDCNQNWSSSIDV